MCVCVECLCGVQTGQSWQKIARPPPLAFGEVHSKVNQALSIFFQKTHLGGKRLLILFGGVTVEFVLRLERVLAKRESLWSLRKLVPCLSSLRYLLPTEASTSVNLKLHFV